jgi:hypothetical protein
MSRRIGRGNRVRTECPVGRGRRAQQSPHQSAPLTIFRTPSKLISKYYKTNLIAVFLMGKRRPPDDWMMNMSEWQRQFVEIINSIPENIRLVSIPLLFLAILIYFVEFMKNEYIAKDYHPNRLSNSFLRVGKYTIGILDPFSVTESLINMISVPLWEKRSQIQRFKQFRLIGPQLLQAAYSSSRETSQ